MRDIGNLEAYLEDNPLDRLAWLVLADAREEAGFDGSAERALVEFIGPEKRWEHSPAFAAFHGHFNKQWDNRVDGWQLFLSIWCGQKLLDSGDDAHYHYDDTKRNPNKHHGMFYPMYHQAPSSASPFIVWHSSGPRKIDFSLYCRPEMFLRLYRKGLKCQSTSGDTSDTKETESTVTSA